MRRKEIIKNVVYISLILLIAIASTYYIYYKFQNDTDADFNSESLSISYHDSFENRIKLTKVTPVTDSVGLSSVAHSYTVKNNLTVKVPYTVKLLDDYETIKEDECGESLIGNENIRVSIKVGKRANKIYNLNELEDGILLEGIIEPLESTDIIIRTWVNIDSELTGGLNMHYHGKVMIIEDDYKSLISE